MATGTDLFNSTKGKFGEYATLLGGKAPETDNWFVDAFNTVDFVSVVSETFSPSSEGLIPAGNVLNEHQFTLTQRSTLKNCATVVEFAISNIYADFKIGVYGRQNSGDHLYALIDETSNTFKIYKNVSGSDTELASASNIVLESNTTYWLTFITVDNYVRAEFWKTDPRTTTTCQSRITATLTGADIDLFDVESEIGIKKWVPKDAGARITNMEVGFAFADNTDAISATIAQQHVDIRDFINYKYPLRYRTMKELANFHITEKAFSQTITLDVTLTGGTFNILFYPSDSDPYVPITIGPFQYNDSNNDIKSVLNAAITPEINGRYNYTIASDDPIKNVSNDLTDSTKQSLMIEFNESFGEMSLLQMALDSVTPAATSTEIYDATSEVGTFFPTTFDANKYIETADPLDKSLTLDDLRIEYAYKDENWQLYSGTTPANAPSKSHFRGNDLFVGKLAEEGNFRGARLSFARAMKKSGANWSVCLQSFAKSVNCTSIGASSYISIVFSEYPWDPGTNTSVIDTSNTGCYVQFTSHPLGKFSDQGGDSSVDSDQVPFDGKLNYTAGAVNSSDVEFISAMSEFTSGAGSNFNFSRVTGVRIYFKGAMQSESSLVKVMAIRSVPLSKTTGSERWLSVETNTLEQNISIPVNSFSESRLSIPPMINGAEQGTIASDPSPIDSQHAVVFQTGLGQTPLRAITDVSGTGSVVTFSTANAHRLVPGQVISISGVDPSNYNLGGVEVVSCPTNKTFTVASTETGSYVSGGEVSEDSPAYNRVMVFAREQEFDELGRSSWLTAEYNFRMSVGNEDSYIKRYKTSRVKSTDGSIILYWDVHPGEIFEDDYDPSKTGISYLPNLNVETNYELSCSFTGNSIGVKIQELTSAEQPQRIIFDAMPASSEKWSPISGRIGWYAEFADYDTYISAVDLESAAYALLVTKPFTSETPVEGGQLFTVDSGNKNLFENFFPLSQNDRVYIDNQKTYSQTGSFTFQSYGGSKNPGIISNQFTVNDWNHLFIEFQFWAPRELKTDELRPKMSLRPVEQPEGTSGSDIFSGIVPVNAPIAFDFVPGAWSYVSFDLRGTNAKNGDYYLVIASDGGGDADLSSFRNKWWVDSVQINTQTIEWEMRAIKNGSWTPFRKNVNKPYGALHLSENQIGKSVQLQARALTEDAWVAEYTFIPKYISSGRVYNKQDYTVAKALGAATVGAGMTASYKMTSTASAGAAIRGVLDVTDYENPVYHYENTGFIGSSSVVSAPVEAYIPRAVVHSTDSGKVIGKTEILSLIRHKDG
jgi:hypothetical protein